MFDDIQRYLRPSARDEDIRNFGSFRWGEIDIEECKQRFIKANKIPVDIPTDVFEEWLKSEGWLWENA